MRIRRVSTWIEHFEVVHSTLGTNVEWWSQTSEVVAAPLAVVAVEVRIGDDRTTRAETMKRTETATMAVAATGLIALSRAMKEPKDPR